MTLTHRNQGVIVSILLLAGIPFEGSFWKEVQARLTHHERSSFTWTLCKDAGSMGEQIQLLKNFIETNDVDTIVAHGLSLPLAIEASHISTNSRLIVSNGLLTPNIGLIKWVLPRLQQLPCTLKRQLLRPSISIPEMSSSAAFRRLVINPYVMNLSTLDDLTKVLLTDVNYRKHVSKYLTSLENWTLRSPSNTDVYGIWGDHDLLFPMTQIEGVRTQFPTLSGQTVTIPGGAHFHPIERPWSIADAIHTILPER